jgi:ATP-binding cassette subfamily B protein
LERPARAASIRRIAQSYAPLLYLLLPLALLDGVLDAGLTLSYKYLVDTAIVPHNARALTIILVILAGGAGIGSALSIWRDRLYSTAVGRLLRQIREALFEQCQYLSASFRAGHPVADIVARFSIDLAGLDAWLSGALNSLLLPVMNILTGIGLLFFLLPWQVATVAVLVWPVVLIAPRLVAPHAASAASRKRIDESALLSSVEESLATHAVVRAFNLQNFAYTRFLERLLPLTASTVQATFFGLLAERATVITIYLVQIVSVGFGAALAFGGHLSVGSFLAFLTAFWNLGWSTVVIARSAPTIVLAGVAIRRLDELLREPLDASEQSGKPALPPMHSAIEFEDVAFAYPGRGTVLAHLTFRIPHGDFVAFVGPSGAGKSTIYNLVAGFNAPSAGRILVDGRDVALADAASLRAQMGFVFQESVLFNATLAENISLGSVNASPERVVNAALQARVHDTIAKLPLGYDTIVGDAGTSLSGGQRQRIGIARALFRNPAVLLLDEATSALDPETEAEVNGTLLAAAAGRTTIAITHRLMSVAHADTIFVVNDGGIQESGSHEQLLAADGTYAELWRKQSGFQISRDGGSASITAERLRQIDLLSSLNDDQLATLSRTFASVRVPGGQVVIREGDPGDLFYVIARGRVAVTRAGSSGAAVDVATLDSGDEFGEMALLNDSPRNATVTTCVDSLFLTLSREQFQDFLKNAGIRERLTTLAVGRAGPQEAENGENRANGETPPC